IYNSPAALHELPPRYHIQKPPGERRPLRPREVGEIASPARVVDAQPTALALHRQSGRGGNHPVAHERCGSNRLIVGSRDRVADPGIDAVEPIACRDLEVSLDRARLAAQPEEPVAAAAGAGYLIH